MTEPASPTTAELDQAAVDAGRRLVLAEMARPRDPVAVAEARAALEEVRAARWPDA